MIIELSHGAKKSVLLNYDFECKHPFILTKSEIEIPCLELDLQQNLLQVFNLKRIS